MELQAVQQASGFGRREGLVECSGRVGRQIVQHDADALRFGKVDVYEFPHADREVDGGATVGDFDLAPGPVHVEEDEQVGGAIALILAIVTLQLARLGLDRLTNLADELGRAFVETDHWTLGILLLSVEVEHILHAGDELAVDLKECTTCPCARA